MNQFPSGRSPGQQLTRFLLGFAIVEGAVLAAILLAMVFEVITIEAMIPLFIGVAVVGGIVLTWRIMSMQRRAGQQRPGGASQIPGADSDSPGPTSPELDGLGQKDPMAKFRDPNR